MENAEFLHRYEDIMTCSVDYDGDFTGHGTLRLYCHKYKITKRTPKGAWITDGGVKRFVLLTARKQFACETEELALRSFVFRKKRQKTIYEARLRQTNQALQLAEVKLNDEPEKKLCDISLATF